MRQLGCKFPRTIFFSLKTQCQFKFHFQCKCPLQVWHDVNAFCKGTDANCPYDAHVSFHRCEFPWCKYDFLWCKFPCKDAQFIHDNANAPFVGMSWCKCPFVSMSLCKCPFLGMSWCKCPLGACYDANVRLWVCNDANVLLWECHNANTTLWVWHDVNVPWEYAKMRMPPWRCTMMQMFIWCMLWCKCMLESMLWCECSIEGMQWCKCSLSACYDANAPLLVCNDVNVCMGVCHDASVPLWVCHDANVPLGVWHKCFDVNTIYSKIFFVFKMRLPQRLKNIFKTWFIIPEKSSFLTWGSKKKLVITVRNLRMGHWLKILMIWLKRFIFTIWLSKKGGTLSGPFFGKNEFFENQAF